MQLTVKVNLTRKIKPLPKQLAQPRAKEKPILKLLMMQSRRLMMQKMQKKEIRKIKKGQKENWRP